MKTSGASTRSALITLLTCASLIALIIPSAEAADKPASAKGRKVLWIDSYHKGFPWSDGTEAGLRKALAGSGTRLEIIRMDAKHKPGKEEQQHAGDIVTRKVESFHPDVIIASDDPAQTFAVVPHLLDKGIPIVFTGVNWDAAPYGYPRHGITGMVEVDAIDTLVKHLKSLAKGPRIALIAADNISEQKSIDHYTKPGQLLASGAIIAKVKTFEEFQKRFLELQTEADAIILGDNSSVTGWDYIKAVIWLSENTRVPTGALKEWHARLAVITVAKLAEEQGEYAGKTAIRILKGSSPDSMPIVANERYRLYLNKPLADKMKIVFPLPLLRAETRLPPTP